jgi:hypothetical protein
MNGLRILCCAAGIALSLAACGGHKTDQTNTTSTTRTDQTGSMRESGSMAGSTTPTGLHCGAVKPVWVNTRTHVYHEPGDPYYGKTKSGKYLCPRQAVAEGDRAAHETRGQATPR